MSLEVVGNYSPGEDGQLKMDATSIRVSSGANCGLIKSANLEDVQEIVDFQLGNLRKLRTHLVQHPNYVSAAHVAPIEWGCLSHPSDRVAWCYEFNIVGTSNLTMEELNNIPTIEDLGDFAKHLITLLHPAEPMLEEDSIYLDFHKNDLIDDVYCISPEPF